MFDEMVGAKIVACTQIVGGYCHKNIKKMLTAVHLMLPLFDNRTGHLFKLAHIHLFHSLICVIYFT
jgi:hypothetical protein